MRVEDKNFQYYWGSLKNAIFRVEKSHEKPKNRKDCLKRGLSQLADLIGGLSKKKGAEVLRGGEEISQWTLWIKNPRA